LPALPASLQELYCSNNQLKELPATLPASLQELYCSYNQLKELPATLPTSLQELECFYNKYMHISHCNAIRFHLKKTSNYNEKAIMIQRIWRARRQLNKLKFLKSLEQHIDEFRYRPGNAGYKGLATKNDHLFRNYKN
jgi:Leucine-rich repeat (LRR) protein